MTVLSTCLHSMPTLHLSPSLPRRAAARSRGFGLLQVLLLISVMAGLAAIGYMQWRERSAVDTSRQEQRALAQADHAIMAYATVARRLPCPDTDRDGLEDCGATGQKGWLPTVSLRMAGVDPGVNVGQLRYMVQRGGDKNDLTLLTDNWRPLAYDETAKTYLAMRGAPYPLTMQTLPDLCQRIVEARKEASAATPPAVGLARVNASPIRATAYVLAHPGINDADGDGDLFDGANANSAANANLMEDPIRRSALSGYNDVVLERSFASLQAAFHCDPLIDSINTVALAHDVTLGVASMQQDNIAAARRAVAFMALAAAMTALEIALAIAEGISDAGNAAIDWAACAASLGLAVNFCAAAPQHTAAIALAGGVVYANAAAVALNATAAGIAGTALRLADSSAKPEDICPPLSDADKARLQTAANQAAQEVTDAENARLAVVEEIRLKTIERDTAISNRTIAVNALYVLIRGGAHHSDLDDELAALLAATLDWGNTSYTLAAADSQVAQLNDLLNRWNAEIAKYDAMLADPAGNASRLRAEIATLDAQIAVTPPGTTRDNLVNQRDGKKAELQLAENTTTLTNARAKAIVERDKVQAALNGPTGALAVQSQASSAYALAQSTYASAYTNLINAAGRYTIYNSDNSVAGVRCTTGCLVGDPAGANINAAFNTALNDLLGAGRATSPSTDAIYLLPIKRQKELDALGKKLTAAEQRKTDAVTQNNQIQNMINNPAACNATGSTVVPMTPDQAEAILIEVDRRGGTR